MSPLRRARPAPTAADAPAPAGGDGDGPLLQVEDLTVGFSTPRGVVHAVQGVSYAVGRGEVLAILGESGSGKSVSVRTVMGLVPRPPAFVAGGRVRFMGSDLLALRQRDLRRLCGRHLALVPQDPLSALNPVYPVGWQIAEVVRAHTGAGRAAARRTAVDLMDRVRIPSAATRFDEYPHHFSGGMRQRALIAMALALGPELVIADEPTTALDVTTQAQILDLLAELQAERGMSLVLISHDLGVVADLADRVVVMYAGRVVETGTAAEVLGGSRHPYTAGLRRSRPRMGTRGQRLTPIPGAPPDLAALPEGCSFHPRCAWAVPGCRASVPVLLGPGGHRVACHRAEEVRDDLAG